MWIIGNEVRHASFDRTNLSKGHDWVDKQYCVKLRRFAGGGVEVCCHRIDPLQQKRNSESAMLGGLLKAKRVMDEPKREKSEEEQQADNRLRSIRRARQQVRWAIKSIGADHLLTLTYRTVDGVAMDDIERLKGDWDRFRRIIKKGLPAHNGFGAHRGIEDWHFVAIRERQDNGSYHLHVAVKGRQDIGFLRRAWFVAIGGQQDDKGERTLGNIDVRGPQKRWGTKSSEWRGDRLAGYMTKYLHKCFDDPGEMKFAKRYWAGRGNPKPEVERIWLGAQSFDSAIVSAHGIFRGATAAPGAKIWASEGYDTIWLSG